MLLATLYRKVCAPFQGTLLNKSGCALPVFIERCPPCDPGSIGTTRKRFLSIITEPVLWPRRAGKPGSAPAALSAKKPAGQREALNSGRGKEQEGPSRMFSVFNSRQGRAGGKVGVFLGEYEKIANIHGDVLRTPHF